MKRNPIESLIGLAKRRNTEALLLFGTIVLVIGLETIINPGNSNNNEEGFNLAQSIASLLGEVDPIYVNRHQSQGSNNPLGSTIFETSRP